MKWHSITRYAGRSGGTPAEEGIFRILPRPGALNLALSILVASFSAAYIISGDIQGFDPDSSTAVRIIFSLVSVNVLAFAIEAASFGIRAVARVLSLFTITFLSGFMAYHLSSTGPVDASLVADNFALLGSSESFAVVRSVFGPKLLALWLTIIVASFFLEIRFSLFSRNTNGRPPLPKLVLSLSLYAAVVFIPYPPQDELTLFAKQALLRGTSAQATIPSDGSFPYIRSIPPRSSATPRIPRQKRRPNIILVMVESFNANFAETRSPEGSFYTPAFNELIRKGLYIERFYGNSMQTCKGQEATLFSILPSSSGKMFVNYPRTSLLGIPSVLAGAGYRTVFFQGYSDITFDNTFDGMKRAGFAEIKTFDEFRRPEDKSHIWGWGVEDSVFYKRFFDMLDREHAANQDQPVFATLATIGTHIPCEGMPDQRIKLYAKPANLRERYANALHLGDAAFADLMRMIHERPWMDNTVVIITADHSFPMHEHGIWNNEICSYDETFRIPFLIIWDGVIAPERVKDRVYSQMDIAPTVMELAGLSGQYPFQGISVFDREKDHPVYLVQPYNGRFFEIVRYPDKFVRHESTGEERLYDLSRDPGERENTLSSADPRKLGVFKKDLEYFHINQMLIETDRVWRQTR